jgi:hypothetical protein
MNPTNSNNPSNSIDPISLQLLPPRESDAVSQAHVVGTGRDQTLVHPVVAEVALLGHISDWIEINGTIGALVHAGLTAGAPVAVHHHNAVFPLGDGPLKACLNAGRVFTVPAQMDPIHKLHSVVFIPWTVFCDGDQLHPLGGTHFLFTRHLAGLAPPAGLLMDDQLAVVFHVTPYLFSG